jgi:diadenosine tetraphosphate (Ap4A) HIT family hydrolase/acetyltransferase-like isoleucine patch superfamily enzyme
MLNTLQPECPFCDISVNRRTFIDKADCRVILAKHAVHKGQSLVIPKRHVSTLNELTYFELCSMILSAKEAIKTLQESEVADDFNVVINDGILAGQTVPHVHIHLIPRLAGDCAEPKRWFSDRLFELLKEISKSELEETALALRSDLKSTNEKINIVKPYTVGTSRTIPTWIKINQPCIIEDGVILGGYGSDNMNSNGNTDIIIDQGANIRSGSIIYHGVQIGKNFDCGHNVLIRDGTIIGTDVYVYSGTQIHRDVYIGDSCVIAGWLGNGSVVEDKVKMFGHLVHAYETDRGSIHEPAPLIRTGAFIGWNSTVIGGVEIGSSAVVGAGSVVASNIAASTVVAGNPARRIEPSL